MSPSEAATAIVQLLKAEPEWRQFYRQCCELGALRVCSQAWQFRDELRERGHRFALRDVEDALLAVARKVLPTSPAAQWDTEWAGELVHDALARLAEHHAGLSAGEKDALDLSGQGEWEDRLHAAGLANDPADFRAALEGWERATAHAFSTAARTSGAA